MTGPRTETDLPPLPEPTWRNAEAYRFDPFDLEGDDKADDVPAPRNGLSVWLIVLLYFSSIVGGAVALAHIFPGGQ